MTSREGRVNALGRAALALAAALAGCTVSRTEKYRFDIEPTIGLVAVDIENFRGRVEVRSQHAGDEATVYATAHASFGRKEQAQAVLDEIRTRADFEIDGARAVLRVRTESPRENTGDHWVDLLVRLPRCRGVRIDNTGGVVLVVGAAGGVQITNRLGPVEYRTDQPMTDPVSITTTDGNVYYQVPPESEGVFDVQTLAGSVWYRDRVQGTDRAYVAPGTHQCRLNDGTNPVALRTNRGDINVWVDKNSLALTRLVRYTLPDPRDYWFLQGSRRYTRNLPEDHPELTRALAQPRHTGGY